MEFSKLPSKQHALIEYLYNHSYQNSNIELARQFQMRNIDFTFLATNGYIIAQALGTNGLTYRIAPKGQSYYANYLANLEEQNYQRDKDRVTLEIAKEANEIAKVANQRAKRANIISVVAIIVSVLATVLSILLPLLLKR